MTRILLLNGLGPGAYGGGIGILRHLLERFAASPSVSLSLAACGGWDGLPPSVQRIVLPPPPAPGRLWRLAPVLRARHIAAHLPRDALAAADHVICMDQHFALAVAGLARDKLIHLSLSCVPRQEAAAGESWSVVAQYVWLERKLAARARVVIAASQAHAQEMRVHDHLPQLRPRVIHPILPQAPRKGTPRDPVPCDHVGTPMILSAGRLEPGKGFDHVIDLADGLRGVPCRFVIAGDGPARAGLMARAAALDLGARLQFVGPVADLGPLLAQADVLLHTSPYESFGMVMFEAMAAGTVPAGRADPGCVLGYREIMTDGQDCVLLDLTRRDQAVLRLRDLLTQPAWRAQLAAQARSRAASYLHGPDYAARLAAAAGIGL